MPKRRYYVLLCTNERPAGNPKGCCTSRGSSELRERFAEVLARENLRDRVRVVRTSCLDNCSHGPTVAVFPDDIWYRGVQAADVEEIVASHFQAGRPVERLILAPADFD